MLPGLPLCGSSARLVARGQGGLGPGEGPSFLDRPPRRPALCRGGPVSRWGSVASGRGGARAPRHGAPLRMIAVRGHAVAMESRWPARCPLARAHAAPRQSLGLPPKRGGAVRCGLCALVRPRASMSGSPFLDRGGAHRYDAPIVAEEVCAPVGVPSPQVWRLASAAFFTSLPPHLHLRVAGQLWEKVLGLITFTRRLRSMPPPRRLAEGRARNWNDMRDGSASSSSDSDEDRCRRRLLMRRGWNLGIRRNVMPKLGVAFGASRFRTWGS